jgi:hypothetical protein
MQVEHFFWGLYRPEKSQQCQPVLPASSANVTAIPECDFESEWPI